MAYFPRTSRAHDAVWVIRDWLIESAHFLALQMTFTLEESCRLYIWEIVQLHGDSIFIVLDQDPRFMAYFWESFQQAMGTRLMMSTTFHPQINDQTERTIQTLEDILWACVWILRVAGKSIYP